MVSSGGTWIYRERPKKLLVGTLIASLAFAVVYFIYSEEGLGVALRTGAADDIDSDTTAESNASVVVMYNVSEVTRDGHLISLANILNAQKSFFRGWKETAEKYGTFMDILEPWILSPPAVPVAPQYPFKLPPVAKPNCSLPRYSNVLTGTQLESPRAIVDLIPFGYDIDKLELRFYEYYDFVDAFVVYESPFTRSGIKKALYFQKIVSDPRFTPFMNKVIYLNATEEELRAQAIEVRGKKNHGGLEASMRYEMVRRFNRTNHPLKVALLTKLDDAYAIQNDGDELVTSDVLNHLRHCEIAKGVQSIYAPCTSFKKNFHWLQRTFDLGCLKGPDIDKDTSALKGFLWKPAPFFWPLRYILERGDTARGDVKNVCEHHMGLGAASHMSSVAEPVEYWLKRGGVCEQTFSGALAAEVVKAARKGAVTPELIYRHAIQPWCGRGASKNAVHVDTLSKKVRDIIEMSIPRIARMYPERYPFMFPSRNGNAGTVGIMKQTGEKKWGDQCRYTTDSY
jgi:Glycosyltransferase family 17